MNQHLFVCCVFVACQHSPAPSATADPTDPLVAPDVVVVDPASGEEFVVTPDGEEHPLMDVTGDFLTSATVTAQSSFGAATDGAARDTAAPCATGVTIPATLPPRVMLDEVGCASATDSCVTPVKNQHKRGTCQTFAAAGAIESAYLVEHDITLDLSEEYFTAVFAEWQPVFRIGQGSQDLFKTLAPYCDAPPSYSLPLETAWPYVPSSAPKLAAAVRSTPQAPSDTFGLSLLLSDSNKGHFSGAKPPKNQLPMDLTNYSQEVYPPESVHAQALYGVSKYVLLPDPALDKSNDCEGANEAACYAAALPIEAALAAKHAMAFGTQFHRWQWDASNQRYDNGPNSSSGGGHEMVVVGYDHAQKIFRIKNSWGDSWRDHGFTNVTYRTLLQWGKAFVYVSLVRPPAHQYPAPGGFLRGFWQAHLLGQDGVAVIRHAYGDSAIDTSEAAGTFYTANGSFDFNLISWTVSGSNITGHFSVVSDNAPPTFTLTWALAASGSAPSLVIKAPSQAPSTWYKCNYNNAPLSVDPAATNPSNPYLAAAGDPYVLPPCNGSTGWHEAPTPACANDDTQLVMAENIGFVDASGNASQVIGTVCVVESSKHAPKCPASAPNLWIDAEGDVGKDNMSGVVDPDRHADVDVCAPKDEAKGYGCQGDTANPVSGKTACSYATCPAVESVLGQAGAVPLLGGASGVLAMPGNDACVSEIAAPLSVCAAGFSVGGPNQNDCFALGF